MTNDAKQNDSEKNDPKKSEREVRFSPTDADLRDDVRTLGALVGEVLREQGGEDFFREVEAARVAAIARREGKVGAADELDATLAGDSPERAEGLARAFSTYFQVVNLAEQTHRIRRRRDYLRSGDPQPGSLLDGVRRLRDAGVDAESARRLFTELSIEPVFTAHPTEATRRTLLNKQQWIARRLVERFDPFRTPEEERTALERIRADVAAGWQTEEQPSVRPTVADEREHVLFYLTDLLYRVVPPFYEALEEALAEVYGEDAADLPPLSADLLRFASWVGGDMDGNPNVTADTVRGTLRRHRQLVLGLYRRELDQLYRRLSQSRSRAGFTGELLDRIENDPNHHRVLGEVPARHREMPYRVLLTLMHRRLGRTAADRDGGYAGAGELRADLELIARSLEANRGEHAGLFNVRRAIRRVDTFGFHLATLDVRQDAAVHRRVVGRLLGEEGWEGLDADRRAERLRRELGTATPGGDGATDDETDDETTATLEVFRAVGDCLERYGQRAIGPYVISMARGVDDVLSVLYLARRAGLADAGGTTSNDTVPIDVAPLFETVPDLDAAGDVLGRLLADPVYRRLLRARGDRQMVMIGYSDSNKDGGLAASRWALYRGQRALVEAVGGTGVELTLFHGRGGTISRGGGKTGRAIAATPKGALAGRLRVTEQGEMIHAKYGLRGIALRTLEQTATAVALATADPPGGGAAEDPRHGRWQEVMAEIAAASRDAYRHLVYETPEFLDYFRNATPIDAIERMPIGSRPASRRSRQGLDNLRAIPWVFAWTQSRHVLPGWYGLGTGLERAVERFGRDPVAEMAAEWPFLRALLEDAEMVLAKADLGIAERYAALAGAAGEAIFPRIREEHERTVARVLDLHGRDHLLDAEPVLQRAIRLRNPYVDPMSLLQVDLLRRWRATDREDEDLFRALLATLRGIARGLQNTG